MFKLPSGAATAETSKVNPLLIREEVKVSVHPGLACENSRLESPAVFAPPLRGSPGIPGVGGVGWGGVKGGRGLVHL